MGRVIEQYQGRDALVTLLSDTPAAFFKTYIKIYKKHEDAEIVKFSSSVEKILQSL